MRVTPYLRLGLFLFITILGTPLGCAYIGLVVNFIFHILT
jgi:hypothetical protein